MNTPLFATLFASAPVKAVFGSAPLRVYPAGDAPAKGAAGFQVPYAEFRTIAGTPENYLNQVPDWDGWRVQIDVYAGTSGAASDGAELIRDALEPVAYVASYNGDNRDPDTQLFRYSFDVSFQAART